MFYWIALQRKCIFSGFSVFIDSNVRIIIKSGSIKIGENVHLSRNSTLKVSDQGSISIGSGVFINENTRIIAHESIIIKNNCIIADSVSIYDHDHLFADNKKLIGEQGYVSSPIIIDENVWVGSHVVICKGVKIGKNVVIGAGAVVVNSIPENSIVGGVPAKVIKNK